MIFQKYNQGGWGNLFFFFYKIDNYRKVDFMKIALGCDHGGLNLKAEIANYLKSQNIEFKDFGTYTEESCDYADIALPVAEAVVAVLEPLAAWNLGDSIISTVSLSASSSSDISPY